MPSTPVRVLIVDDHPFVRDGLQHLLERSGEFEVVGHAGDGHEAERIAKSIVPDLIIMDVLMPDRDGIEACREIVDALPNTHVLMLTASTERNAVLEAVAAGAAGYVQKFVTDGAAADYGQGRGQGRVPDAPGRHAPGVQAIAQRSETGRSAKAKETHAEGEGDTRTVRQGHVVHRHRRVPGQPSLRRCATPSTAYRTSWDSTASRRS